jgi:uncharacterized protein YqjF (DUF2071 family)
VRKYLPFPWHAIYTTFLPTQYYMPWKFLSGEWRKLIMINYQVEPQILQPLLPTGTKLNLYKGKCFVTLAAFMFNNIKVKGITIPFHNHVDEVNLRFYVVPDNESQEERGVVFIQESIPKPLLAYSANFLYKEHYEVKPVRHSWKTDLDHQHIQYFWKDAQWNFLDIKATKNASPIEAGSEEEFISLQLRGYTKVNEHKTFRYIVKHPLWTTYPITHAEINVDFKNAYGEDFSFLEFQKPSSIFLAEGSPVSIMMRQRLRTDHR